jgi:hypothetical protein
MDHMDDGMKEIMNHFDHINRTIRRNYPVNHGGKIEIDEETNSNTNNRKIKKQYQ